jgi:hypothetical protein
VIKSSIQWTLDESSYTALITEAKRQRAQASGRIGVHGVTLINLLAKAFPSDLTPFNDASA